MPAQPSRRPRGTGSLIDRPDKGGGRTWYASYYANGRRRQVRLGPVREKGATTGLSRKEAEAELRARMSSARPCDDRLLPSSMPLTVETVAGLVMEKQAVEGRSPRTIDAFERTLRLYLKPRFKSQSLREIKRADVNALLKDVIAQGRSPKTAKNVRGDLAQILNYAIAEGWLDRNVTAGAWMPRDQQLSDLRFLEVPELEELVAKGPNSDDSIGRELEGDLYLVAAMTGMRQGELLGLWWQEVDFDRQVIRVERQWRGPKLGYGPPKDRERRSVPMAPRVGEVLARRALAAQGKPKGRALVFPDPETGEAMNRYRISSRRMRDACVRAGVRVITFHQLRHTFGTTMARGGASPVQLMDWLGHSEFVTTQKYLHYSPRADEAQRIGDAFAPSPPPADESVHADTEQQS